MAKSQANNKHFVIDIDEKIIEKAEVNSLREATTLRRLVEKFIVEQSKKVIAHADAYIQEADAIKEVWCASRGTLYSMRKSGELQQGTHYILSDGLIFYKLKVTREYFTRNYPHIAAANKRRADLEAPTG